jgi:kynurenine 3-monooxygenase
VAERRGPGPIAIVGAGLVGSLLAAYLGRRGYRVQVFERDPDPRLCRGPRGASINLTLSARGLAALDEIQVGDAVRARAVAASARVLHLSDGTLQRLPYSESGEALLSIKRDELNDLLISHAEADFSVPFAFGRCCTGVDPTTAELLLENATRRRIVRRRIIRSRPRCIVGADGAFSAVRQRLQQRYGFNYSQRYSEHAYTQVDVPRSDVSGWLAMRDALHVWPRGDSMLLAIPNRDGSFTATLLLPLNGPRSHATLKRDSDVVELVRTLFPDAVDHLPTLVDDYRSHRAVPMVTIRCRPWSYTSRVLLIGDAAHAIFPSYGQGANAGLEDCRLLDECLDAHDDDWAAAVEDFEARRRPQTDAIAALSEQHLDALRETMGTDEFIVRHRLERRLAQLYPGAYRPLHGAISFTTVPYAEAVRRDASWRPLVDRLCNLSTVRERIDDPATERTIRELVAASGLVPESNAAGATMTPFTHRAGASTT